MRNLVLISLLSLLVACSDSPRVSPDIAPDLEGLIAAESARLNAWLDERFQQELDFSPEWKTSLGDKSDRGFYDTVLSGGALPLPVLEARVARWIEAVRSSS